LSCSSCARLTTGSLSFVIITIYHPGSEAVTPAFFNDLSETLDCVASYNEQIYVVGDLNVRLDRKDDVSSQQRLTELSDSYGFVVGLCVDEPTHNLGGILDIVENFQHVAICRYHPSPSTMLGCQTTICYSGQSRYQDLLRQSRQSCVVRGTDSASTCCRTVSSSQSLRFVSQTAGQTCQSTSSLYYTTARLRRYWMSSSRPVLSPFVVAHSLF